jgi:hypothetical protein
MKQTLLSAILLFTALAACKKDDDPSLQEERRKIILNGNWNMVYRGEDANKDGQYDIADDFENYLAECQKDDTYTFQNDNKYTIAPNANTNGCTTETILGSWELNADGTTLVMDTYQGKIDSITTNYIRYHLDIDDYTIYYILKK